MKRALLLAALVGAVGLLAGCASPAKTEDVVVIEVTTSRYQFTPGTEAPLVVPLGATIILRVTSTDVTHGLAVDGYNVQEEIPAGQTVDIRFVADKAGEFTLYCTVFCGAGHPQHKGTLHVA